MRTMPAVVLAVCFRAATAAELPEPQTVWEYDCGGPLATTPVLFPSVGAPTGVIVATRDGRMMLVDAKGKRVWEHTFGERAAAAPAVGDVDGDGKPEIVTATITGTLVVLAADGTERWRFPLGGKVVDWSSPCLPDLDGDGAREIVIGDQSGWLNCLSGDGKRRWRVTVDAYQVSPAAFVEGTGGGPDTILFGTENDHMAAVGSTGELVWLARHVGQFGRTAPTAGDLDGDGDYEAAFITSFNNPDSRLWVLDAGDGTLAWSAKLNLHGYGAIAIADLDGDADNEVVLGLRSNTVYCFDGDGTERWHTITGGHAFCWTPAVADINGDGRCEVIGGVRQKNERGKSWFVFDEKGTLLGEYAMPGGVNGAPLVADIDRDGRLDIILPGTDAGKLRCVTFGGKAQGARMPWVSHRYDAARLGRVPVSKPRADKKTAPSAAPRLLDAAWAAPITWGANALKVNWPDSAAKRLVVEVAVTDPLGRRTTRVRDLSPDELPETLSVDLIGSGEHAIAVRLWDASSWTACSYAWKTTARVGGFDTVSAGVTGKLDQLAKTADALVNTAPATARLLRERRAQRLGALDALATRAAKTDLGHAPNADRLSDEIRALRAAVDEDSALCRVAESAGASQPGHSIIAWQDPNPWDRVPALLEGADPAANVTVDVPLYLGEYESRAVTVVNLRPEPLDVQVRAAKETRAAVRFYEVIETPARDGRSIPDALSELNSAWTLRLAPGEARRLWLAVNGKILEAGDNKLPFALTALAPRADSVEITVRAQALDIDLRKAPTFRVCNWSSPGRIRGSGIGIESLHQAKEHGMNVFTTGVPTPRCDKDGNLVGKLDWTRFDADLALMEPDGFALFSTSGVRPPKGVEPFGPVRVKAQRAWLRAVTDHLASKGWGTDRWALYPIDEPGLYGGTRIVEFTEIARSFREAMPEAPIYANPTGFVTRENMAVMVPLVDVWCPEQQLLRRQPELAEFFLATGKPVWSYEAPPDSKMQLPLGYYRANAWMAFQLGLAGTGFWTQFYGGAHYGGNDMWLPGKGTLYGANYVVSGNEVISRRWEAFRDGIEDVRAFLMLREAIKQARAKGAHTDTVARAERLLDTDVRRVTQKAWPCSDPTRFLRDHEMDYAEIKRIRKEVAALTTALQKP